MMLKENSAPFFYFKSLPVLVTLLLAGIFCEAQVPLLNDSNRVFRDTSAINATVIADTVIVAKDTIPKAVHSPRKAAIRSAILPGLGQIYNKKYWKLPIVYGALGISAGVFIYNFGQYKDTRFAYKVKYNMRVNKTDSALYSQIKATLQPLTEESLRFYRDQFRRDIDYSALIFILLWGLNVVDATVDAHLKSFDVGPNLGLMIKPGHSSMAGTNGLSLVFTIGKHKTPG